MTDLEQIQQTLLQIYSKNLDFFKYHHLDIYHKIKSFEENFQENYYIDFIDNHFELCDSKGNKTYKCDPFYDAQYRAQNLDKNISGISTIDFENRKVITNKEYDSNKLINQFIELLNGKACDEKTNFHKFIFIGTLLGVHINDIAKKLDVESIFIVEQDLEIFRLSIFLTDYEILSKKSKLFFAVGFNETELLNITKQFLEYKSQYNYFIKFEITSENEIETLKTLQNMISSQSKTIYSYSQFLEAYEHSITNISNINRILKLNKKESILNGTNILFIGAGPSLQDNIDFIKLNKDKFIIITVLATLKRFEKEQIVPDIILSIDSSELLDNFLPKDTKYYKNSIIITSTNTYPNLFNTLNNLSKIFLLQTNLDIFDNFGNFTGYNIGDVGIQILLQLGANNIYLLGIDAALNQNTGQTHDDTHSYIKKKDLTITTDSNIDFGEQIITLKGNLQDIVYTTGAYKLMYDSINDINIPNNIKIYNLSNHGVRFNNIEPKKISDIQIKTNYNKKLEIDSIYNSLEKINSDVDLSKSNINMIKNQIKDKYIELINPYIYYIKDNKINNTTNEIYKQQMKIIDSFL
jgi:hypothetical protein